MGAWGSSIPSPKKKETHHSEWTRPLDLNSGMAWNFSEVFFGKDTSLSFLSDNCNYFDYAMARWTAWHPNAQIKRVSIIPQVTFWCFFLCLKQGSLAPTLCPPKTSQVIIPSTTISSTHPSRKLRHRCNWACTLGPRSSTKRWPGTVFWMPQRYPRFTRQHSKIWHFYKPVS